MRLVFSIIFFSSSCFSMQDPKNMSREQLEEEYKSSQRIIAEKERTIKEQQMAFDILWKLNYGTQLERLCAKQDLERAQNVSNLKNTKKLEYKKILGEL